MVKMRWTNSYETHMYIDILKSVPIKKRRVNNGGGRWTERGRKERKEENDINDQEHILLKFLRN